MLLQDLEKIGLSRNEARVYTGVLESGPSSVLEISRKSGVKRGTVYEILPELKSKKLVRETRRGTKRLFVAAKPSVLLKRVEEQRDLLKTILPELHNLTKSAGTKPKVLFYDTTEGLRDAYEDTIHSKPTEILSVASVKGATEVLGQEWAENYVSRRVDAHIPARLICVDTPKDFAYWSKKDREQKRQTKFLQQENPSKTDLQIYGDKVMFHAFSGSTLALIIESPEIAGFMRSFFETMWRLLPKSEV